MSGDKKQSFYALLMMGLIWAIALFTTLSDERSPLVMRLMWAFALLMMGLI
jgi:hypothetical protein